MIDVAGPSDHNNHYKYTEKFEKCPLLTQEIKRIRETKESANITVDNFSYCNNTKPS